MEFRRPIKKEKPRSKFNDPHKNTKEKIQIITELFNLIRSGQLTAEQFLDRCDNIKDLKDIRNKIGMSLYNILQSKPPKNIQPTIQEIYKLCSSINTEEELQYAKDSYRKENSSDSESKKNWHDTNDSQQNNFDNKSKKNWHNTNNSQKNGSTHTTSDWYNLEEFMQDEDRKQQFEKLEEEHKKIFEEQIIVLQEIKQTKNEYEVWNNEDFIQKKLKIILNTHNKWEIEKITQQKLRRKIIQFYHPDKYANHPIIIQSLLEKIFKELKTIFQPT